MTFTPASNGSVAAFLTVVAVVIAAALAATYRGTARLDGPAPARRRTLAVTIGLAAWLGLAGAVVATGAPSRHPMPAVPLFLAAVVLASVGFGLSPTGGRIARGVALPWLVLFQGFRLPLELVLHSWADQGTIPPTMTWTGQNPDILSGIAALALAPFANRHRGAAWLANVVGIALLINVGRVAAMSSPLPFAWDVHPPLQLVFHWPYWLIGPVCVGGAAAGHVVLTRALLARR
jgi:hypothetical protein